MPSVPGANAMQGRAGERGGRRRQSPLQRGLHWAGELRVVRLSRLGTVCGELSLIPRSGLLYGRTGYDVIKQLSPHSLLGFFIPWTMQSILLCRRNES